MRNKLRLTLLITVLAVATGSLVALFLFLLEIITEFRFQHRWLLYSLPLTGLIIYFIYRSFGKSSVAGNNLIIEEIHAPKAGVPVRMGPLILFTTLLTHLSGGSAGREGTAVQMGASLFTTIARWITISRKEKRLLLMCGMAAGFGAVFGTPFAGAVFAIEVLTKGRIHLRGFLPCLLASFIGHFTCIATGIHHSTYSFVMPTTFQAAFSYVFSNPSIIIGSIIAAAVFGGVAFLFITAIHFIHGIAKKYMKPDWTLPIVGAMIIILLTMLLNTQDFLGIGIYETSGRGISLKNAFILHDNSLLGWWWKLLFTAITLGTGFKGGEVTPLFFIGAMAGNALATIAGYPIDMFAALGFIGVFAAATKAPVTSILIGIELFGAEYFFLYALVCFIANALSGPRSIYSTQRNRRKH